MRITAINNNISRPIIGQNQRQTRANYFVNNNQMQNNNISFGATIKNTLLKMEANNHLKESQKITSQAKKILTQADKYSLKARKLQNEAANALADSLPLIDVAQTMGGRYLFNNLPQDIQCVCSNPMNDGYHVYVKRNDGTERHVFARNKKIYIYECDDSKNVKQMYTFNKETQELETCMLNFRTESGYSIADEKYTFVDGQIKTIDEQLQIENNCTYEKALSRYEFTDGELSECVYGLENFDGIKGKLDQVFSFSNRLIYNYCEGVVRRFEDDVLSAQKRMFFNPDESLRMYISKLDDLEDYIQSDVKIFQYDNSQPLMAILPDKNGKKIVKF